MRTLLLLTGVFLFFCGAGVAQKACTTTEYYRAKLTGNPTLAARLQKMESSLRPQLRETGTNGSTGSEVQQGVITIPVVVHVLYHQPSENITDQQVIGQIGMLNMSYRMKNADTANIPQMFKALAADCEIEFRLATSDPKRRGTTGIVRKYTPVAEWGMDDKMKFSSEMGDDAWDPQSYLNIWVCSLKRIAGYSSVPGDELSKDGVVIDGAVFGFNYNPGYELGRTAVHEVGHWLGLKHIWGDEYCGDDFVDDTPKQANFTTGCPAGLRPSCNNSGDMYSNYMDYTNDGCINLFTHGQKDRMRNLFAAAGYRSSILNSKGLSAPLIEESPLPDEPPRWLQPRVYPNPATTEMTIDLAYDPRWAGKRFMVHDINGRVVMQFVMTSTIRVIDISRLIPGMYFLSAGKEDGSYIKQKFIKM